MELRFANQVVAQGTNLKRADIDFGEVHCQLVVTETAANLKIYDENLREGHEMDGGLTLSRAGQRMVCEPRSHVYLHYSDRIEHLEDVALYRFKWDMKAMREGFDYFRGKWDIDINHRGRYERFMTFVNRRVGFCTRLWPSQPSLAIDKALFQLKKTLLNRGFDSHG